MSHNHRLLKRKLQPFFLSEIAVHLEGAVSDEVLVYVAGLLGRYADIESLPQGGDHTWSAWPIVTDLIIMREKVANETLDIAQGYNPFRAQCQLCIIGDYALFLSGVFSHLVKRRANLPYYIGVGSDAYNEYAQGAKEIGMRGSAELYFELSRAFEVCAQGLKRASARWNIA